MIIIPGARLYLGVIEYDLAYKNESQLWIKTMRDKYEIPKHIQSCQVRRYLKILAEKLKCKRTGKK